MGTPAGRVSEAVGTGQPGIYTPILTVEYGMLNIDDVMREGGDAYMVDMKFEVEYTKDLESFWDWMKALFSVAMTLTFIEWIYRSDLFAIKEMISPVCATYISSL